MLPQVAAIVGLARKLNIYVTRRAIAAGAQNDVEFWVTAMPDGEDVARMREVVASHLDRFAFREAPLTFDWREG